jgi:uncharacterized protein YegP (UPF0339 family)
MAKTKFEIYKDNKGNYRWRLLAQNGEPVASSGEGFSEKRTAMNAVKKLKDWANTENILDVEKIKEDAIKAKAKAIADAKKPTAKKSAVVKKVATKAAPAKKSVAKPAAKKSPAVKAEVKSTPSVL